MLPIVGVKMMGCLWSVRYCFCRRGPVNVVLIIAAGMFVFACSRAAIKPDQQIPLPADTRYESAVKTSDYSIDYQMVYQPADAAGGGKLALKGKLIPRRGLDTLIIWINFLDAEGTIISTKTLYSPGAGRGAARTNLEQTFEVPPGTISVAFTHDARVEGPIILD